MKVIRKGKKKIKWIKQKSKDWMESNKNIKSYEEKPTFKHPLMVTWEVITIFQIEPNKQITNDIKHT